MPRLTTLLSRLSSEYGMLLVLLLLCAFFSLATLSQQHPTGASAGEELADEIIGGFPEGARVLIVARKTGEDAVFAEVLRERLNAAGREVIGTVLGGPDAARLALKGVADKGGKLDVVACNDTTAQWEVITDRASLFPSLAGSALVSPASYPWPTFLKPANLRNITGQIAVIAILAVGMTLVVFTGGIDLSVGSLLALSAVISTLLIRDLAGAGAATATEMVLCCLAGIAACTLVGLFSGSMVTFFNLPPFIVTLTVMLVARGLAYELAGGQSVHGMPLTFTWLGLGQDFFGVPNQVVLMILLYAAGHVLMTRMTLGRYIYAVGGNFEAARLSGVPVRGVLLLVYALCGALAGVGGVVFASQLRSGDPKYGETDELMAIAAVVLGGTSIRGGQGKILGTLIGAFIIAVIQNGMNLLGLRSERQLVVLGAAILGGVLFDRLKGGWRERE